MSCCEVAISLLAKLPRASSTCITMRRPSYIRQVVCQACVSRVGQGTSEHGGVSGCTKHRLQIEVESLLENGSIVNWPGLR